MRFLSFNIHGGRMLGGQPDIKLINAMMDRLNIDIGVFQEMETRAKYGASQADIINLSGLDRPHHLIGASKRQGSGWYGNLIVSRWPILRGIVHDLETRKGMQPRNAIDALIDTPTGKIRLIGTHLSLSLVERWSEAQNLLRLMKAVEETERLPLFLMGDMNEWQYPSRLLNFLNSNMTPCKSEKTFPSFFPIFRLDRAWHDAPNYKVSAHRLIGKDIRKLSDHLPLVVDAEYSLPLP